MFSLHLCSGVKIMQLSNRIYDFSSCYIKSCRVQLSDRVQLVPPSTYSSLFEERDGCFLTSLFLALINFCLFICFALIILKCRLMPVETIFVADYFLLLSEAYLLNTIRFISISKVTDHNN